MSRLFVLPAAAAAALLFTPPADAAARWDRGVVLPGVDRALVAVEPGGATSVAWNTGETPRARARVRSVSATGVLGAARELGPGRPVGVARARGVTVVVSERGAAGRRQLVTQRSDDQWRARPLVVDGKPAVALQAAVALPGGEFAAVVIGRKRWARCAVTVGAARCTPFEDRDQIDQTADQNRAWSALGDGGLLAVGDGLGAFMLSASGDSLRPLTVAPPAGLPETQQYGEPAIDGTADRIGFSVVQSQLWGDSGPRGQILFGLGDVTNGVGQLRAIPGIRPKDGIEPEIALLPGDKAVVSWIRKSRDGFSTIGRPKWAIVDASGVLSQFSVGNQRGVTLRLDRLEGGAIATWLTVPKRKTTRLDAALIDASGKTTVLPNGLPIDGDSDWLPPTIAVSGSHAVAVVQAPGEPSPRLHRVVR